MHSVSPLSLLRAGLRSLRHAWLPLLAAMLAMNLLMLLVVSPVIGWLFREALRANGMHALDLAAVRFTGGSGLGLTLIVIILLLAFWLASVQFIVLLVMLRRIRESHALTLRALWGELGSTTRKLVRPSSFPLFVYLFVLLPLSGFGFLSTLSQGIAVPSFISGELMKSPATAAVWIGFLLLLALLNLRYSLALPLFVRTSSTGGQAMRQSWRLTSGWASVRLALAVSVVLLAAGLATSLLLLAAVAPTALADALAPESSHVVAAFSLALAQFAGMALTACVGAVIGAILLELVAQRMDRLSRGIDLTSSDAHLPGSGRHPRGLGWAVLGGVLVLSIGLGILHLGTMQRLSQQPETLVVAHRGFSDHGAENTIEGLEAAHAAGADMVEMDVMQTADRRFVVMHDASLLRLTGTDENVKDLTLAELTQRTVRDQHGHQGKIPSLEAYITRAAQLEMPLLIEVKLGGLDTPDHVDLLVAELAELDALDRNIFHTLDGASADRLKQLRPDTSVGYILALAGMGIPDTHADFIVVEQWSATEEMEEAAARAGLGFFSWTVNDDAGAREFLRRNTDGIITDHPDRALTLRGEMQQETGLAGTLLDALSRFVVVF